MRSSTTPQPKSTARCIETSRARTSERQGLWPSCDGRRMCETAAPTRAPPRSRPRPSLTPLKTAKLSRRHRGGSWLRAHQRYLTEEVSLVEVSQFDGSAAAWQRHGRHCSFEDEIHGVDSSPSSKRTEPGASSSSPTSVMSWRRMSEGRATRSGTSAKSCAASSLRSRSPGSLKAGGAADSVPPALGSWLGRTRGHGRHRSDDDVRQPRHDGYNWGALWDRLDVLAFAR